MNGAFTKLLLSGVIVGTLASSSTSSAQELPERDQRGNYSIEKVLIQTTFGHIWI